MIPHLTVIEGQAFVGATIVLDGKWFQDCTLTDCTLIFRGRETFGYSQSTRLAACSLILEEAARSVVGTLAHWLDDDALLALFAGARADRPAAN